MTQPRSRYQQTSRCRPSTQSLSTTRYVRLLRIENSRRRSWLSNRSSDSMCVSTKERVDRKNQSIKNSKSILADDSYHRPSPNSTSMTTKRRALSRLKPFSGCVMWPISQIWRSLRRRKVRKLSATLRSKWMRNGRITVPPPPPPSLPASTKPA